MGVKVMVEREVYDWWAYLQITAVGTLFMCSISLACL